MYKISCIIVISVFLIGCTSSKNDYELLSLDNIEVKNLDSEFLSKVSDLDSLQQVEGFFRLNDSINLYFYKETPRSKNILVFENNKSGERRGFFTFGRGHNETAGSYVFPYGQHVLMNDVANQRFSIIPIDSVFLPEYEPTQQQLVLSVNNIAINKNLDLITSNRDFFNYKSIEQHYNPKAPPIIKLKRENNYKIEPVFYEKYVSSISSKLIFVNDDKNRVVTFGRKVPEITVMDTLFNEIRTIVGPDRFEYKFIDKENSIRFEGLKNYEIYLAGYGTPEAIFVTYPGAQVSPKKSTKCKLMQFDWDGNLQKVWQLDRWIYDITVNDGVLYGTSYIDKSLGYFKHTL